MPIESPDDRRLMTPSQVSELLHVPCSTLAIWRSSGRVKIAYTKIGRAVRYVRTAVERHIAQNSRDHDPR